MEEWEEKKSPQLKIVSSFPILGNGAARLATPSGGESSSLKLEMEPDT